MRFIIALMMLFSYQCLSAQFVVSSNGIHTESEKTFYVKEFENQSAEKLYKEVLSYITSTYRNPDIVSNTIPDEMINMHGFSSDAFVAKYQKLGNIEWFAHVDYNLIISFKDGKIRFDAPAINKLYIVGSKGEEIPINFHTGGGFFGGGSIKMFEKDGKIKDERCVKGLTQFINKLVNSICNYVSNYDQSNDW